jgi:hypothetical protein
MVDIDLVVKKSLCFDRLTGHRQPFGQIPPLGQLEEVVDGADDGPLGAHFFEAAQQELAESAGLFDLSELSRPTGVLPRRRNNETASLA